MKERIGAVLLFVCSIATSAVADAGGDYNADGVVDNADFPIIWSCLSGPAYEVTLSCYGPDEDRNYTVDLRDLALFQNRFGSTAEPANPNCPALTSLGITDLHFRADGWDGSSTLLASIIAANGVQVDELVAEQYWYIPQVLLQTSWSDPVLYNYATTGLTSITCPIEITDIPDGAWWIRAEVTFVCEPEGHYESQIFSVSQLDGD